LSVVVYPQNMKKFSAVVACAVGLVAGSGIAVAQPAAKEAPTYIEIPLKGAFGEEITAPGVFNALTQAKSKKIKHAVFVLDSGGGVVADARAIEKTMDQFEGDITFHVVVVKGISASMAVVSGCRDVFMPPGGATGAAVSFSTNVDTGNAEVDAKMNAAWGSELAARADKHGQPGLLYRAMVEKGAEVWWGKNADGKMVLAPTSTGLTDADQVDSPDRVLAMTTEEALKYGFAKPISSNDGSAVGAAIGVKPWVSTGDLGARLMKAGQMEVAGKKAEVVRSAEEFKKYDKEIDDQIKRYKTAMANARSSADLREAGSALEVIKTDQRIMESISRGFSAKGKAWLKARRIDENLFKETLPVPKFDIDLSAEQARLAGYIARMKGK
jgi:ATP-dependent protease ClpP protease subunit